MTYLPSLVNVYVEIDDDDVDDDDVDDDDIWK
jgi:hypothetical protein